MKTLLTLLISILTLTGFSQSINGMVTSCGTTLSSNGIDLNFASGHPIILSNDGSDILFDNIITGGSVGITEVNDAHSISFYPNPTTAFLKSDEPNIESLEVFTLTGSLVKQVNMESIIDVNDLPSGTYILIAKSNNKVSTHKFIKK